MHLVRQRQLTHPRVSVVIMMRNEAATIGWTLDSLKRQELDESFEVIFVDGASDDSTVETIAAHPLSEEVDTTIAVLPVENSGMCVAQNVGADLSRGEILLFMQADLRVRSPHGLADTLACFDDPEVVALGASPGDV